MKQLLYIKANGKYYKPQKVGVQDPDKKKGVNLPVCKITKLLSGVWRVDYHDDYIQNHVLKIWTIRPENKPNTTLYLYPKSIEEIKYIYSNDE